MILWILGGDFSGYARHVRFGCGKRHTRFSPSVCDVGRSRSLMRIQRHPDIGFNSSRCNSRHRQMKRRWHHSCYGVATAVERERFTDDLRISTEALPKRVRDHGTAVIPKPVAKRRFDPEIVNQGYRDGDAIDVMRLPRERQVLAGRPKPSERIKQLGPLLVLFRILSPKK